MQHKHQPKLPIDNQSQLDMASARVEANTAPTNRTRKHTSGFIKSTYVQVRKVQQSTTEQIKHHQIVARAVFGGMALLMFFVVALDSKQFQERADKYDLNRIQNSLLDTPVQLYADKLKLDEQTQSYIYNQGYKPGGEVAGQSSAPKITANFGGSLSNNIVSVGDPVNDVGVGFKPKFAVDEPLKNANRVVYPVKGRHASKVYTLKATGVKEDIILHSYQGDSVKFEYELQVPDGLEARMENDGSIGVYSGPTELIGNVATGSEKDAEMLKKVRENTEKTNLLFRIPAPFIIEKGKKPSTAKTWYGLKNNILTVFATGLGEASYPLSIDPSVYVETAAKLMRGNNESNIDFDIDNELIQKGKTTGGRFDAWTSTMALPSARWNHATAAAGGYIYVVGGNSGSAQVSNIYWARLNTTTGAIEATNPGAGACTNWCTDSAYDLPAARDGASLVAYNGYLYLFGGRDGSGNRTNTVYIAKIGANGEPSLWHPTDTNKNNWVYWYSDTALSSERSFSSAVAYNNRVYLLGGQTNASAGGVTTVEYANVSPVGTLSSWTSTGMVALPSARHNHTVQVYNDRMYLIGGNSSGTLQSSVHYIKLHTDGTMLGGSWTASSSFTTARMAWGGNISTIWGGYIYLTGGCTAINGSGYCTTIASDIQLASLNADGTVTEWTTVASVTSARMGFGFTAWRNKLYGIGGCTAHNTSTGNCTTTATLTQYGAINQDGDASTISNSVTIGSSECAGSDPYNCNLPPIGNGNGQGGHMSGGVVINNGFIYYVGGCYSVGVSNVCHAGNSARSTDTIYYAALASDGSLRRPATCTGTNIQYAGSWCVNNSQTINGSTGLAGFGVAVFNNVIYAVGGTTGSNWQDNVWYTSLNADGSLNAWTSQTFAAVGLGEAKGYSFVFARANPAAMSTFPGDLFVLGGCRGDPTTDNGLDCGDVQYSDVYKCKISTTGALGTGGDVCTTSGQLQLDSEPNTSGTQGLGAMAGAVYANYVYLIGGQSPNEGERGQVMYARLDNSNNMVAVSGGIWQTSTNEMDPPRRRNTAFGYNGYLYALAGYAEGTGLNDLLFAKIDVSNGSIGEFNTSTVTVNQRWDIRAVVSNSYVYTLGGCGSGSPPQNCDSMDPVVQRFQLYNNHSGSPASYSAGANLFGNGTAGTSNRIGSGAVVLNGYLYIAGGCISATDCTDTTNDVQYASLSSTGVLGTWNATTAALPADRAWGQLEVIGNYIYYLGGQDDTATNEQSTIYYAQPSSGNISSWSTASGGIGDTNSQAAQPRTKFGAAVWNNRIYVVGGLNSSGNPTNTVYISPVPDSGGDLAADGWTEDSDTLNVARSGNTVVAYANNLYSFGGYEGTYYLNDSQFAKINSDGTIGSWGYTTSLPTRLRDADGFAANGFLYIFGGRSADATCPSNTIVAPISANTTIASGNNPTGVGDWFETNAKYTGDRYGGATAYYEGKAYIVGGGCGATITYTGANRVVQTTLQSQPQIARYSRFIDTDTDVFPTKWLMNGLDNSTGAEWYMRYRSSTATTAAWGQETNFGRVTLGNPEDYIPRDSGGSNTNFARYYYLRVTIDSQFAYGYPEDVTRGPTIADLSLFFTADPSKRMRHGKTFTGGELQPLDTPF